uniref:DUF19 domain-containing protein n=1 Tax=Caenorhabditis tropicalis TaxID=1561998 RepID=A0A1I7V2C3_9PELO
MSKLSSFFLCFLFCFSETAPVNSSSLDASLCVSQESQAATITCSTLMIEFSNHTVELAEQETEVDDPRILKLIQQCGEIETCMKKSCYMTDDVKEDMKIACEGIKLKNTEFMVCLNKIGKVKPDKSKYICLEDREKTGKEPGDLMFTTKRQCTKGIMADICGEKAVEGFGKNVDTMNELAKMAMKYVNSSKK